MTGRDMQVDTWGAPDTTSSPKAGCAPFGSSWTARTPRRCRSDHDTGQLGSHLKTESSPDMVRAVREICPAQHRRVHPCDDAKCTRGHPCSAHRMTLRWSRWEGHRTCADASATRTNASTGEVPAHASGGEGGQRRIRSHRRYRPGSNFRGLPLRKPRGPQAVAIGAAVPHPSTPDANELIIRPFKGATPWNAPTLSRPPATAARTWS